MLSASEKFKRQLNLDNRDYLVKVNMTLYNGTTLEITNDDIWADGITITEATSSTSSFDIGSAVIGSCKITLNNITETFSEFDFYNATFTIYLGLLLEDGTIEYIKRGYYTVDEADYNGSLITLNCLDNMWTFDVPYSEVGTSFKNGATCAQIVRDLVVHCLGSATYLDTQTFPNSAFVLYERPTEDMNCREVLSYIAQICCCYAKINVDGRLVLAWYDVAANSGGYGFDGGTFSTKTRPYSDGDNVEGGRYYWDGNKYVWTDTLNYEGGSFVAYDKAYITKNATIQVGTDDISITGIRVYKSGSEDEAYDVTVGRAGYVLGITNNPFITKDNCNSVANIIYSGTSGLSFRTFTSSTLNDITYESGDTCEINDFRGNRYYSYITNLTFQLGNYESFICGAESPAKKLTVRYSDAVKTLVEAERRTTEQLSSYDVAVQQMNMLASNMMGVYFGYQENKETGARIYYTSNKRFVLDDEGQIKSCTKGSSVWKRNAEGYFICSKAESTDVTKLLYVAGINNTGDIVARVIATLGLSADWITAGTINVGGKDKKCAGRISVFDDSNAEKVTLSTSGLEIKKGSINISDNFTVNSSGKVAIKSGSINLGAEYKNDKLDHYNFSVTDSGEVTINNGTIKSYNYEYKDGNFSVKGTAIDLSTGVIRSKNFAIDSDGSAYYNGKVSASNISGQVTTSQVEFKVLGESNIVGTINSSTEGVVINSNKIEFNGTAIFKAINGDKGSTTSIDGGKITANSINGNRIMTNTLSANTIHGGTLTLGGSENGNGECSVKNEYNVDVVKLNKDGITARRGYIGNGASGWTITDYSIYNGRPALWDTSAGYAGAGTYFGTDGFISSLNSTSYTWIAGGQIGSTGGDINFGGGNFHVDNNGSLTIKAGMFYQYGDGYMSLNLDKEQDTWQFRFGPQNVYCKYYASGDWHVAQGATFKWYDFINHAFDRSDKRIKHDITPIDNQLSNDLIMNTKTYSFRYDYDDRELCYGVISQEVDELIKSLGIKGATKLVTIPNDEEEYQSVNYKQYIPHLINVAQQQQEEINALKSEIEALKDIVNKLGKENNHGYKVKAW